MSDLVKRLREHCMFTDWQVAIREAHEAADRIAQLEAALRFYAEQFCEGPDEACGKLSDLRCSGCKARATLEERT